MLSSSSSLCQEVRADHQPSLPASTKSNQMTLDAIRYARTPRSLSLGHVRGVGNHSARLDHVKMKQHNYAQCASSLHKFIERSGPV